MPEADPFRRHRRDAPGTVRGGDPAEIRRLYAELGEDLWASAQDDPTSVPVLSAPETAPLVIRCLGPGGLVLDAGCGPNPAAGIGVAQQPGCRVVAMDVGLGMVRTARRIAADRGVELLGVCADLEHLPFRHGAFDGLLCDDTIEHVPDDRAAVAELARVLRPGGTAVVATPNRRSAAVLVSRAHDLAHGRLRPAQSYYAAESHLREYTWRGFERLLGPHLRVESRHSTGWSDGRRLGRLNRFVDRRPVRAVGQMLVVRATPHPPGRGGR